MENDEKLISFLIKWGKKHNFMLVLPNNIKDDENIDFININLKTKKIYFGDLEITKPLTDVG